MRRRLFTIASALSLLLCAGTVALWVEDINSDLWRGHATTLGELNSFGSSWAYAHTISKSAAPVKLTLWGFSYSVAPIDDKDYGSRGWTSPPVGMECEISGPYWAATLLTAILPVTWVVSLVRRKRTGLCSNCAYNLTGNASGICPECGTPIR